MIKFKVTFGKASKVMIPGTPSILQLAEQNYFVEDDKLDIQVPNGYTVMTITEYLPDYPNLSEVKLSKVN